MKQQKYFDILDEILEKEWNQSDTKRRIDIRGLQRFLAIKPAIRVNLSQTDLEDLDAGCEFDWTFETKQGVPVDIHLFKSDDECE